MKKLYFVTLIVLVGCSSGAINSIRKERNYSTSENKQIEKYFNKYNSMLSHGLAGSTMFNSSNLTTAQNNVQKVFCNCVSKLGDSCQAPSKKSFNSSKKRIWLKGNAAEIALHATNNGALADRDMCP